MASCRRCGAIPADGRKRSSAASTRAWTLAIQAVNSLVVVGTGEVFQRVFFEHLDLLLCAREHALTVLSQLETPLVRGKGLLQSQLPGLHAGHDLLQLGQGAFEALGLIGLGGFPHRGGAGRQALRCQQTAKYPMTKGRSNEARERTPEGLRGPLGTGRAGED